MTGVTSVGGRTIVYRKYEKVYWDTEIPAYEIKKAQEMNHQYEMLHMMVKMACYKIVIPFL